MRTTKTGQPNSGAKQGGDVNPMDASVSPSTSPTDVLAGARQQGFSYSGSLKVADLMKLEGLKRWFFAGALVGSRVSELTKTEARSLLKFINQKDLRGYRVVDYSQDVDGDQIRWFGIKGKDGTNVGAERVHSLEFVYSDPNSVSSYIARAMLRQMKVNGLDTSAIADRYLDWNKEFEK